MTREEYSILSIEAQEEFINNGGIIDLPKDCVREANNSISGLAVSTDLKRNESKLQNKQSLGNYFPQPPVSLDSGVENKQLDSFSVPLLAEVGKEAPTSKVVLSNTGQASPTVSLSSHDVSEELVGFDFKDPIELLMMVDKSLSSGKVKLHPWQVQFLLDFSQGGQDDTTPFQAVVRACNGSGKDKYLVAACAVWLCMRYPLAISVITSSSGAQLDRQTCRYIKYLALQVNRTFGREFWQLNYRNYKCLFGDDNISEIFCYATDEPGKAEGYHPTEHKAKMAIFASEDKTIPDEINTAMSKCTGYTHRCHVSTPGLPMGHFFDYCSVAVDRKAVKSVTEVNDWIQYHITYKDCPHITDNYRIQCARDLPGGETGAAYKSQFLAEFGTTDEMVVIPYSYIWKAKNIPLGRWLPEEHNKAGLDLSDGGDETVLVVRNGNRVLKIIPFRFDNPQDTIEFLQEQFKENNLQHPDAYIFADCGGIGSPMLSQLKRKGWTNIRYIDNRARSNRPKTYKNYGAQLWFDFSNLLKKGEIILLDDGQTIKQMSTRWYKIIDGAIHQLLSKIEMRSRGYLSPDRADAHILAFADYKSTVIEGDSEEKKPFEVVEKETKTVGDFSLKSWASGEHDSMRGKYNINNKQKDFSEVEEQLAEYNRNVVLTRN